MPRSISDLDASLTALEQRVPRDYRGVLQTLNQSNLALNGELQKLATRVGSAVNEQGDAQPTGLFSSLAAINSRLDGIEARLSALEQLGSGLQTQQFVNTNTDNSDRTLILDLQAALIQLQATVAALQTP